jgi:polyhydroxyalkanoate synthesis regulator phasin
VIDEFKRLALFTSGVAELTRNRAEQVVRDMVKSGEVRREQASSLVKTALDFSRANRKEFIDAIRDEIKNQLARAGFATKRDFERLERRVARLETRSKKTTGKSAARSPRKTTKKPTTRPSQSDGRGSGSTPG